MTLILAIESSCDDTAAAVSSDDKILANVVAGQQVHQAWGGVVPELASRAHQQHIIPVVDQALKLAKVTKNDLSAIACTIGPGLMGSLLVGTSFAKSMAMALGIPYIEVNHMQAHVLANFAITDDKNPSDIPSFPFICLTVSGGHTQLFKVENPYRMELMGETLDDAAGEAFDKIAKIIGLPYPGGPLIDKHAEGGNYLAFKFPVPVVPGLDFSFSGLKTAVLYFVERMKKQDEGFVTVHLSDICASVQHTIVTILMEKLRNAVKQTGIANVALAGGVAANSGLRKAVFSEPGWKVSVPPMALCTDNAAMIAIAGYYKFLKKDFADIYSTPFARFSGL